MTSAIVGVPTAIPIFIGYTQTAPAPLTAVRLSSMDDYVHAFGGAPEARYGAVPATAQDSEFAAGGSLYRLERLSGQFNLFVAMSLFFANGGGDCFVVSAGDYSDPVAKQDLLDGLGAAQSTAGPTMLVLPDACLLAASDYGEVAVAQLDHCAALGDRVAILDLPGALDPAGWTPAGLAASRDAFLSAIAPAASAFSYGAAYAPALAVSAFGDDDIDAASLQGMPDGADLGQVKSILLGKLNVAAPSGAMAGGWADIDLKEGVWKAPAGLSVTAEIAPKVALGDADMAVYQPDVGNAINVIRNNAVQVPVVWGARTLDGNRDDYRYIQARRTLIYIEQSIKNALQQFVFAPNDAQTWSAVTAMVNAFLNGLCLQGAFTADSAAASFSVACGLGSTMTADDIRNGVMIVQVEVSLVYRAEFVALTIEQAMQGP